MKFLGEALEAARVDGKVVGYVLHPAATHHDATISEVCVIGSSDKKILDREAISRAPTETALTISNLLGAPMGTDGKHSLVALHNYCTLPERQVTFVAPEVFENPDNLAVIKSNSDMINRARCGHKTCRTEAEKAYRERTGGTGRG